MNVTTVGIDLAKNVFSVHGVGRDGKALLRRSVGRADLLPMFALIKIVVCPLFQSPISCPSRQGQRARPQDRSGLPGTALDRPVRRHL
ncbi:MAG: hypothetical protein AzoDbin1_04494 [Azoarcus sp.]|nr:hypothetical protein [Azoarcus sp.]